MIKLNKKESPLNCALGKLTIISKSPSINLYLILKTTKRKKKLEVIMGWFASWIGFLLIKTLLFIYYIKAPQFVKTFCSKTKMKMMKYSMISIKMTMKMTMKMRPSTLKIKRQIKNKLH